MYVMVMDDGSWALGACESGKVHTDSGDGWTPSPSKGLAAKQYALNVPLLAGNAGRGASWDHAGGQGRWQDASLVP